MMNRFLRPRTLLAATIPLFATISTSTASAERGSVLDPEITGPAEVAMTSGRETRLPITPFFRQEQTRRGTHRLSFRAVCSRGRAGVMVRARDASGQVGAWFANGDVGVAPTVVGPARSTTTSYDLFAWSRDRGTSLCDLQVGQPGTQFVSVGVQEVGGTLVDVGAMPKSDFLEVRTEDDGASAATNTRMVLFDAPLACTGLGTPCAASRSIVEAFSPIGPHTDGDPRIDANVPWTATRNLLLVGRTSPASKFGGKPETKIDLVHGPNDVHGNTAVPFPVDGGEGAAATLPPGRYYVWLWAGTDSPPGELRYHRNDPTGMGEHEVCFDNQCHTAYRCSTSGDDAYARGQLNEEAFTMRLQRLDPVTSQWNDVTTRVVPRGAFGLDNGTDVEMNRFILELDTTEVGTYRLTSGPAPKSREFSPDLSFGEHWGFLRNPDTSELKVATQNMLYKPPSYALEYENVANLLTGRVAMSEGNDQVLQESDRSPYEWEVDVVALTEGGNGGDPYSDFRRFDTEASRGSVSWAHTIGVSEDTWGWDDAGFAGSFVSSTATPPDGIGFTREDNTRPTQCSGAIGSPEATEDSHIRCLLDGDGGDFDNYSIPARATSRRVSATGSTRDADVPVGVFTIHLDHKYTSDRAAEVHSLANIMESFSDRIPGAYSNVGSGARAPGNRFIVVGDANIYSHGCGEHYTMLRTLRERFGYAVDLSMAVDGSAALGFGMHNYGAQTSGPFPVPYVDRDDWRDMDDSDPAKWVIAMSPGANDEAFPWFARTFRQETASPGDSGERFDVIFLVGLGWAGDDPARAYAVMQDSDHCNPFSVKFSDTVCGGVEMYHANSGLGGVPNAWPNYRPRRLALDGSVAENGEPAMVTDHRAIGGRLRVFSDARGTKGESLPTEPGGVSIGR